MERDERTQRLARLLAELAAAEARGDTLDPNDVARLAAGRPSEAVRTAIEARLAGEDAQTVAAVAGVAAERERRQISWKLWAAAAAAVLLAVLGGWLFRGRGDAPSLGEDDLVAVFSTLRSAEPTAFAGIEPLRADEATGPPSAQRGGLLGVGPRGTVLAVRPTLRWQPVAGAAAYEVEVISDEGAAVLTTTTEAGGLAWPANAAPLDEGGEYVVRVASSSAGVRLEGGSAFRVADDAERARYAQALRAIEEIVSPDLRAIVRAQTALGLDLLDEAARQLAGALPETASALHAITQVHLDRRRGLR